MAAAGSGSGCDEYEEHCPGLEPFFFDEAEAVADHERRMRREQEEAQKKEQRVQAANADKLAMAKILDYDPKQGGKYYNRFPFADFSKFNIDEELNILSVKIASLDVDFPINVYGTVIARGNIDGKCIYLFRREKDHCQLINSMVHSSC
ncbi:hypothetical protein C2845_PM12G02210 [Panicum miliaceum]|uniref:DUF6598 domain-containing protein n=1 Tax=Panicum miliaceum TaxID=4540 RepID=A0A3L6QCF7_PANMI|nr:hypothetical protein C2845_PM12G02210 [Panicum miliaceum]